jgi:hypothetical protein
MTANLPADLLDGDHSIVEVYFTILILGFPLLDSKMNETPILITQILLQAPGPEMSFVLRFTG